MSERYNWFSHFENRADGSLFFTDVFRAPPEQAVVCRYELHRISAFPFETNRAGTAAYHRVLPFSRDVSLPESPLFQVSPWPEAFPSDWEKPSLLSYDAGLPLRLALLALQENPLGPWSFSGDAREKIFLAQAAPNLVLSEEPDAGALGPWGNPYRLEAYKILGLEILRRFGEDRPTLVYFDPSGEITQGLILAEQIRAAAGADQLTFRLIPVQQRPRAPISDAIEGRVDAGPATIPAPALGDIALGIHQLMGTAPVLAEDESAESGNFAHAVFPRLDRTGFIDEEDHVLVLMPDWTPF